MSIAWAAEKANTQIAESSSIISDILQAGLAVQLLLLVLIIMSVFSWAIIFNKLQTFKRLKSINEKFSTIFWASSNLQNINGRLGEFGGAPLANIFKDGYQELERLLKLSGGNGANLRPDDIENLERALRKATDREISGLESKMTVLATTGSIAPFIGLLGTVIGIMNSFRDIYNAGSASLATVAPGISEALFATAIGLFAAIPAVVAYNFLLDRIRVIENDMYSFNSDFLNISKRNFFNRGQ